MDSDAPETKYQGEAGEKVLVTVEVCQKSTSTARPEDVRRAVEQLLGNRSFLQTDHVVELHPGEDTFLEEHVESISIADMGDDACGDQVLLFWQIALKVHVYQLSEEGAAEETDDDDDIATFNEWMLPAREFHGMWESLILENGIKQRLLQYASSALLFSDKGVNPHLISWNRVVLLFGPPGTGKTSLCKALAQKLSIRFRSRYRQAQLVEVNAHSLFSKWFSESGKLVGKLFQKIQELLDSSDSLVFVLIDEVESLTAARQAAISGSEPSDSIRVVNALLTQLDALKGRPNALVLTTSNITQAIDLAFVDRADIKQYIGPPGVQARYEILATCIRELQRSTIIQEPPQGHVPVIFSYSRIGHFEGASPMLSTEETEGQRSWTVSHALLAVARACEDLSGRVLRKLPFLAHARTVGRETCSLEEFVAALHRAAEAELADRAEMILHQQH